MTESKADFMPGMQAMRVWSLAKAGLTADHKMTMLSWADVECLNPNWKLLRMHSDSRYHSWRDYNILSRIFLVIETKAMHH